MNFLEIAQNRQSCRNFDNQRIIEQEKIDAIINSAVLSPSACNGQPYHITVCKGDVAKQVAAATMEMGMNKFVSDAPIMIVISEMPYVKAVAASAKLKKIDYRCLDIGILSAYITSEAIVQGLGTCILGWLNSEKIKKTCNLNGEVKLVIALGYPKADDKLRPKIRKNINELVTFLE